MRNLSEVHGIDLIRRMARGKIKDQASLSRVWSEEMHSWGFFAAEPNAIDIFLIMGCAKPGDMLILKAQCSYLYTVPECAVFKNIYANNPYVVLGLKQFQFDDSPVYGLELLSSCPPQVCQIVERQKVLFKVAWESL